MKKDPSDAIEFFKWMNEKGKNRNWFYFRCPYYRTLEEWYKKFRKEMDNK